MEEILKKWMIEHDILSKTYDEVLDGCRDKTDVLIVIGAKIAALQQMILDIDKEIKNGR